MPHALCMSLHLPRTDDRHFHHCTDTHRETASPAVAAEGMDGGVEKVAETVAPPAEAEAAESDPPVPPAADTLTQPPTEAPQGGDSNSDKPGEWTSSTVAHPSMPRVPNHGAVDGISLHGCGWGIGHGMHM